MAGSVLFSTLDITSAYKQVPVMLGDIRKTAFVTNRVQSPQYHQQARGQHHVPELVQGTVDGPHQTR